MAINTELRVSNGTTFSGSEQLVYMRSHYKYIDGLKGTDNKILSDLLPYANVSNGDTGKVKLSKTYNPTTPDDYTALAQEGAKDMYTFLMSKIQNLQSPLDYMTSLEVAWGASKSYTDINNEITNTVQTLPDAPSPHPGSAVLINNKGADGTYFVYLDSENSAGVNIEIDTRGYWLWIYDGSKWKPAIDYPEVPSADYSGTTLDTMKEGIITKSMLWKLKNIEDGAEKNTVYSVAGKTGHIYLEPEDVGLKSENQLEVLSAAKLKTPRKIAGVNFDGTADISIPFKNLSNIPYADIGENNEGIVRFVDPSEISSPLSDFYNNLSNYYNQAISPVSARMMIEDLGSIPIVADIDTANALPRAKKAGSLVLIQLP